MSSKLSGGNVRRIMAKPLVAMILSLSMLLSGCGTSMERIKEQQQLIKTGLTRDEVRGAIGSPDKTYAVEPEPGVKDQTVEVWSYTYKVAGGYDLAVIVIGIAVLALVVVVAAAAAGGKGGGGGFGGLGGGGGGGSDSNEGSTWRFCVGFGPDGKVRGISSLERIKK